MVTDLWFRKIYDWVTLPSIFLAWFIRWIEGGWGGWGEGLASGLWGCCIGAGFLGVFVLWKGGVEWGEVKLMGVVGAVLGWPRAMEALVLVSLFGALQALIAIVVRKICRRRRSLGEEEEERAIIRERFSIPYGVSIALGGIGSLVWSFWIG